MDLREIIARAMADKLSEQQLGSHTPWHDPEFRRNALEVADAVRAAIDSSGTHCVVPLEPTEADIEEVVRADFMRWCVYGGYTDEVKRAEWQRMRNIEMEQFWRRYHAMLSARPRP